MRRQEINRRYPSRRQPFPAIELDDLAAAAGNTIVMINEFYHEVAAYTWDEKRKLVSANPPDHQATVQYNLRHVDVCLATARSLKELEYWEREWERRKQDSDTSFGNHERMQELRRDIVRARRRYLVKDPQDPESPEYWYTHVSSLKDFLRLPLEIRRQVYFHLVGSSRDKLDAVDFRLLHVSSPLHEEYLQEIIHHHWFIAIIFWTGIQLQNNWPNLAEALNWPYYARGQKWRIEIRCNPRESGARKLRRRIEQFVSMLNHNKHLRHLEIVLRTNARGPRWTAVSRAASLIYSTEKQYPLYEEPPLERMPQWRRGYNWIPECGHVSCGKDICLRCPRKTWTLNDSSKPRCLEHSIRSHLCDAQFLLLPFGKLRGLMSVSIEGLEDPLDAIPQSQGKHHYEGGWIHPTLQAWKLDLEAIMKSDNNTNTLTVSQQAIAVEAAKISLEPHGSGQWGLRVPTGKIQDEPIEAAEGCDGRFHDDGMTRPSMSFPVIPLRPRMRNMRSENGQPVSAAPIGDTLCGGECLVDDHTKQMILKTRQLPNCPLNVLQTDSYWGGRI